MSLISGTGQGRRDEPMTEHQRYIHLHLNVKRGSGFYSLPRTLSQPRVILAMA